MEEFNNNVKQMIKLFRNWKLIKTFKGGDIGNIKTCAVILKEEWIEVKHPWINLITIARQCGYTLQNY